MDDEKNPSRFYVGPPSTDHDAGYDDESIKNCFTGRSESQRAASTRLASVSPYRSFSQYVAVKQMLRHSDQCGNILRLDRCWNPESLIYGSVEVSSKLRITACFAPPLPFTLGRLSIFKRFPKQGFATP